MRTIIAILIFMGATTPNKSFAGDLEKAYCTCSGALAAVRAGAILGRSPSHYGLSNSTPLTTWVGIINTWMDRVSEGRFISCSLDAGKVSDVTACRKVMNKY